MLIRSSIAQKLGFLIGGVNIFYDFETFSTVILVILEFAFKFSIKSLGMARLAT